MQITNESLFESNYLVSFRAQEKSQAFSIDSSKIAPTSMFYQTLERLQNTCEQAGILQERSITLYDSSLEDSILEQMVDFMAKDTSCIACIGSRDIAQAKQLLEKSTKYQLTRLAAITEFFLQHIQSKSATIIQSAYRKYLSKKVAIELQSTPPQDLLSYLNKLSKMQLSFVPMHLTQYQLHILTARWIDAFRAQSWQQLISLAYLPSKIIEEEYLLSYDIPKTIIPLLQTIRKTYFKQEEQKIKSMELQEEQKIKSMELMDNCKNLLIEIQKTIQIYTQEIQQQHDSLLEKANTLRSAYNNNNLQSYLALEYLQLREEHLKLSAKKTKYESIAKNKNHEALDSLACFEKLSQVLQLGSEAISPLLQEKKIVQGLLDELYILLADTTIAHQLQQIKKAINPNLLRIASISQLTNAMGVHLPYNAP